MTGQDAISAQRLAEIREIDAAFDTTKPHPFPTRVYAHRRELLAEVDRLTRQAAIKDEAIESLRRTLNHNLERADRLTADRDQARARVAELEAELADAREANQNMREATKRQREGQPCGSPLVHAPHHWMLVDEVMQCPGNRWTAAPDRSDGSGQ